jgi:hypothetical protein
MLTVALGIVLVIIKVLSISPVLPAIQGDCRREWLRTEETDVKSRQGYLAFLPLSVNL